MNQVPVIERNPAYNVDREPDEDVVDQDNVTPLVSGNVPIITVPTSEDRNVAEDTSEDDEADEEVRDILEKIDRLDAENKELRKGIMDLLSSTLEATRSQQQAVVPRVEVWDTGKAWDQEYSQYPDSDMKQVRNRLFNQVWNLLQIMQERVDQHTYNSKDIELISGLKTMSVLNARLSVITETALKHQAEKP